MAIPSVVLKRLKVTVPKFQKILVQAKERDLNESDTVTIITDMLSDVFGWDKYEEVTSEYAIRGTYCDLAIKQKNKVRYLVEVKAVGVALRNNHLRQAVDYAAKEGITWAVLTNGIAWQIHHITVKGKVENELVMDFDFLDIGWRKKDDQEKLFMLCKRGMDKDSLSEYYEYRQSINPFTLSATLQTDAVVALVRREMRRFKPGIKVSTEEIANMIAVDVIKRDLIESDEGKEAMKVVKKKLAQKPAPKRSATKPPETRADASGEGRD